MQPQPGYDISVTHNTDVGNGLARAWNDWTIETNLAFDERLLGSVCVNMNDPLATAAEIRRVGGHPRMVQVLATGESTMLYGHRFYHPVYDPGEFEPTLEGRVVRCPWHGWEFDVVTGKGLFDRKSRVATYEVRVDENGNLVAML